MSILSTSPTSTRHFDMNIAAALGSVNAAIIIQQLNYWMDKPGVGVMINGIKYIYNTFSDWVNEQFKWLSLWQFRKAMSLLRSLGIVKVIRYKSKQWNQTNYYSLNRDRLIEFLNQQTSVTIETMQLCVTPPQAENNQHLEMKESSPSSIKTKITTKEKTTKQEKNKHSDRLTNEQKETAAAQQKNSLNEQKKPQDNYLHPNHLTAYSAQNKQQPKPLDSNIGKETNSLGVDYTVNKDWQKLIPILDSAGVPINKTVKDLLKLYPREKVESAIALVKARKRENYIPNPSGYFVSALKGDWGSKTLVENKGDSDREAEEIDTAAVFRHWYELARELGYCSGQQIKDGEQWVCLSGTWEEWTGAVDRGYTLDYLKKIVKRNSRN